MGLISFGGLGSGLDVNSIIDALVNAERTPKQLSLDSLESRLSLTLSGLGSLKSALDEMKTVATDLATTTNYSQRYTVLAATGFYTASADTTASPGNYDIEVVSTALGSKHKSKVYTGGSSSTVGTGTLSFTANSKTFNVSIASTDTLIDIRDKINAASGNTFVNVNLLNNVTETPDTGSILTFNSSETGLTNDLSVTYTGDAALADLSTGLTSTQTAASAEIKIDGLTSTSETNTFTDVIQGVTVTAKKKHATGGDTTNVVVDLDKTKVKNLINDFVEKFNTYAKTAEGLGSAELTAPGLLLGDATLRQVHGQIRNLMSEKVVEAGTLYNSLASIGIETQSDGSLKLDSTVIDKALDSNFETFDELFTGTNGFASKLDSLLTSYTGSSGVISNREESIDVQMKSITNDRLDLEYRVEQLRTRLVKQFSAMDTIVAQFNSTGSFLTQQLANLPGYGNKK